MEVASEDGYDELLEGVRDRIDEIESLHRTRELTVGFLFYCLLLTRFSVPCSLLRACLLFNLEVILFSFFGLVGCQWPDFLLLVLCSRVSESEHCFLCSSTRFSALQLFFFDSGSFCPRCATERQLIDLFTPFNSSKILTRAIWFG